MSALEKIYRIKDGLETRFVEREEVIEGLFVSLLAEQNMLLLGPPGTAKSMLIRAFSDCLEDGDYFQYLLTKFTTPEEVFGPISLSGLKEDRYERVTNAKLPTARVAFLDEIWKANSSILNSLLTIINERIFFNGTKTEDVPLKMLVGASNEYPQDNSLDALYDRFMLKYWVDYINDDASFSTILGMEDHKMEEKLSQKDIAEIRGTKIHWSDETKALLLEVRQKLKKEKFFFSDRKWFNAMNTIGATTMLNGRDEVQDQDLLILADCMWNIHKDRDTVAKVISKTVDSVGTRITEFKDHLAKMKSDIKQAYPDSLSSLTPEDSMRVINKFAATQSELKTLREKIKTMQEGHSSNSDLTELSSEVKIALKDVATKTMYVASREEPENEKVTKEL